MDFKAALSLFSRCGVGSWSIYLWCFTRSFNFDRYVCLSRIMVLLSLSAGIMIIDSSDLSVLMVFQSKGERLDFGGRYLSFVCIFWISWITALRRRAAFSLLRCVDAM